MTTYPTNQYGDAVLDMGGNNLLRLNQVMVPGNGFIPLDQGQYLTQGAIRQLGKQLFSKLQEEFAPHNITGGTLRAMELQMGSMSVTVRMGRGALLVEGGFPAHEIAVHDRSSALHFVTAEGDTFAKTVQNPGYEGDPFVERAFQRLDINSVLKNLAENVFREIGPNLSIVARSLGGTFQFQGGMETTSSDSGDTAPPIDLGTLTTDGSTDSSTI